MSQLPEGLKALSLNLSTNQVGCLESYLDLLEKWNASINLTAIRDRQRMEVLHLLDSLSVAGHIPKGANLLDVGSGGGLPGIPLAIARPDLSITLLESSNRKASFLQQARMELGLPNVAVVCQRVEQWQSPQGFDCIISRAFSDLPDFVAGAAHLLQPGGRFLAMKGAVPFEEIGRLPQGWESRVLPLEVPSLKAERHLIVVQQGT
jgi:16S rRNA (guanine527-N7)-methyltransferase